LGSDRQETQVQDGLNCAAPVALADAGKAPTKSERGRPRPASGVSTAQVVLHKRLDELGTAVRWKPIRVGGSSPDRSPLCQSHGESYRGVAAASRAAEAPATPPPHERQQRTLGRWRSAQQSAAGAESSLTPRPKAVVQGCPRSNGSGRTKWQGRLVHFPDVTEKLCAKQVPVGWVPTASSHQDLRGQPVGCRCLPSQNASRFRYRSSSAPKAGSSVSRRSVRAGAGSSTADDQAPISRET
jgi:hypothetical protein